MLKQLKPMKESSSPYLENNFETVPSLIKWTGSKRLQAKEIQKFIPTESRRYMEPFLGGGSVLYNNSSKEALVNDIYSPLIEIWNQVKNNPKSLIERYEYEWLRLQECFPDYFYTVRERFNSQPNGDDLLFLSRTAVNGIIRFNSKGDFNNSIHLSRRGMKPLTFSRIVMKWNEKLKNTTFYNEDYKIFLEKAEKGDFVYLDPPYANSKNRYIQNINVDELFSTLEILNNKGVFWALSFDGTRGDNDYQYPVPEHLFKRVVLLSNGSSKVSQVLNGKIEKVQEALYLNY
ncbi:TPA: DNA adenine methylase [Streptococcus suis]